MGIYFSKMLLVEKFSLKQNSKPGLEPTTSALLRRLLNNNTPFALLREVQCVAYLFFTQCLLEIWLLLDHKSRVWLINCRVSKSRTVRAKSHSICCKVHSKLLINYVLNNHKIMVSLKMYEELHCRRLTMHFPSTLATSLGSLLSWALGLSCGLKSLNRLDNESSVTTRFRTPWK